LFYDVPDTLLEQAKMLENILVAACEGDRSSNKLYVQLRAMLLSEPSIEPLLPSFVRTSRDSTISGLTSKASQAIGSRGGSSCAMR
jgi:hypothetical protein